MFGWKLLVPSNKLYRDRKKLASQRPGDANQTCPRLIIPVFHQPTSQYFKLTLNLYTEKSFPEYFYITDPSENILPLDSNCKENISPPSKVGISSNLQALVQRLQEYCSFRKNIPRCFPIWYVCLTLVTQLYKYRTILSACTYK